MASVQGNPGFVTNQKPSAAQWNAAWTTKQDALLSTVEITGDATVVNTACKYKVDTSLGNVTITIPPFGQSGKENKVHFVKKSTTPNSNVVILTQNGSTEIARIINENDSGGAGWMDVYSDNASITETSGVP